MPVTKERQLTVYPPPKYNGLIRAYAKVNELSDSAAASFAIKCFIDALPADQKIKVINAAKELNGKRSSKNSY